MQLTYELCGPHGHGLARMANRGRHLNGALCELGVLAAQSLRHLGVAEALQKSQKALTDAQVQPARLRPLRSASRSRSPM